MGPIEGHMRLLEGHTGTLEGCKTALGQWIEASNLWEVTRMIQLEDIRYSISKEHFDSSSSLLNGTYLGFPLADFDQILI